MNKVDRLLAEAKRIQNECQHQFKIVTPPTLLESLVEDVYVGEAHTALRFPKEDNRNLQKYNINFSLLCSRCSLMKRTTILVTCPKCLSPMSKWDQLNINREKYFGIDYIYYAIRLFSCAAICEIPNFTVATDEWNQ